MTKIEKLAAYRGPDGVLHESREACRGAVLKAIVEREMRQSLSGGEIWIDDVITVVSNKFDLIYREVEKVMCSA